MAGEDFVQVQMSEAGVALAGAGGEIRVENSRSHFHFQAGVAQRVVKSYEWGYLAQQRDAHGQPLFELVPAAVKAPADDHTAQAATLDQVADSAAVTAQLAAEAAAHEAHTDSSEVHQ